MNHFHITERYLFSASGYSQIICRGLYSTLSESSSDPAIASNCGLRKQLFWILAFSENLAVAARFWGDGHTFYGRNLIAD
jgi:hypothetical protein